LWIGELITSDVSMPHILLGPSHDEDFVDMSSAACDEDFVDMSSAACDEEAEQFGLSEASLLSRTPSWVVDGDGFWDHDGLQ